MLRLNKINPVSRARFKWLAGEDQGKVKMMEDFPARKRLRCRRNVFDAFALLSIKGFCASHASIRMSHAAHLSERDFTRDYGFLCENRFPRTLVSCLCGDAETMIESESMHYSGGKRKSLRIVKSNIRCDSDENTTRKKSEQQGKQQRKSCFSLRFAFVSLAEGKLFFSRKYEVDAKKK